VKVVDFRTVVLTLALSATLAAPPAVAVADATEDYPIPHRMITTTCTAEQIMAAARDVEPVYYERYMIDYGHHSADIQRSTRDEIHRFYSLTPAQRQAYSDELASNFADSLTVAWPNHAKLFFNNKGVAAHTTDVCYRYAPNDESVWSW
jgi:Domain of unknown function (DUF5078)